MKILRNWVSKWNDTNNVPAPVTLPHSVNLFYWRPKEGPENFGDHLSKIIVTKILSDRELFLEQETSENGRLLAIGSILHFAKDGDVVWGSGVNGKVPVDMHKFKKLDVRSVRGPKTREFLLDRGISVPEVYGDPALLLSTLLPGYSNATKQNKVLFVPNLHDMKSVPKGMAMISPRDPWNYCVRKIVESEFVISSSLHGIVVADSYGIPSRYVRLSETENLFKYEDYILGSGRRSLQQANSIDEALEMGPMERANFRAEKLMEAFPFDLWRF